MTRAAGAGRDVDPAPGGLGTRRALRTVLALDASGVTALVVLGVAAAVLRLPSAGTLLWTAVVAVVSILPAVVALLVLRAPGRASFRAVLSPGLLLVVAGPAAILLHADPASEGTLALLAPLALLVGGVAVSVAYVVVEARGAARRGATAA